MKKFLTVLLALSVVFTYSFSAVGSVFAAATPAEQANAAIADAQKEMAEYVDEFAGKIVYNQQGNVVSVPDVADASLDKNLTKAAIDAALTKLKADYNEKIATEAAQRVADNNWTDEDTTAVDDIWADLKGTDAYAVGTKLFDETAGAYGAVDGILYTEAVKAAKATAQAAMEAIDPANYSDTDAATIVEKKADLTTVVTIVANSKAGLQKLLGGEAAEDTEKLGAIAVFKNATKDLVTKTDAAAALDKAKKEAVDAVNDAAADFTTAERARLQNIVANPEAASNATEVAEANARLGSLTANVQKVVALYVGQINDAEAESAVTTAKTTALATLAPSANTSEPDNFYKIADKFVNVNLLVKYATDYAAALKNQYSPTTGKAIYNAATVDAALEKLVKLINNLDTTVDTYGKIQTWMQSSTNIPNAEKEIVDLEKVINDGVRLIKTDYAATALESNNTNLSALNKATDKYAPTNWEGDNKDAVETIQKDFEAKIKAAANADAVVALVKEARAAMDKYLTITQTASVKTSVNTQLIAAGYVGGTAAAIDKTTGFLKAYADGVAARDSVNAYANKTKEDAVNQALEVFYDAVNAKQNANLKASEIKAILSENYAAALAKIDAMKADSVLASEAQKVIDAIKALPVTATLEKKADYLAVQKMYEDYLELAGATEASVTNRGLLNAYVTRIITLEKAAAEALVNALPRTITVADKAAVEAARAAVDAYADNYSKYAGYVDIYQTGSGATATDTVVYAALKAAEAALSNAMKADAAKKIAALPEVITAADKEAVDAAKAAYDALSDADRAAFDRDSAALVAKLELAIKTLEKADVEGRIKAVESFKIKVTTKRYTGSKMRINWTATGDESAIDGYRVYYSTKKSNSGYKYLTKTTKKYINHTSIKKNVKKGTRVYYRVRAYVEIDGVRYFSDYSTVGNRIWK